MDEFAPLDPNHKPTKTLEELSVVHPEWAGLAQLASAERKARIRSIEVQESHPEPQPHDTTMTELSFDPDYVATKTWAELAAEHPDWAGLMQLAEAEIAAKFRATSHLTQETSSALEQADGFGRATGEQSNQ